MIRNLLLLVSTLQGPMAPLPRLPLPRPFPGAQSVAANDNHVAGGTLANGVLTLRLDVVDGAWKPEGENDHEVPILAFAESGGKLLTPGPLLRVRQGTEVHVILTNRTDSVLTIGGLRPRAFPGTDTVMLAKRGTREVRYRLTTPGTYFYWGALGTKSWEDRLWYDGSLNGAIVVDPPGGSTEDHIFVIAEWFHPYPDRIFESALVINGKAFPHTERLHLIQGDSTHFRVINTLTFPHPMHLHGFYYRVTARGVWNKDRPIAPAMQPLINTDLLPSGGTLSLAFLPTTPGNWLFHCHFAFHMDHDASLIGVPKDSAEMAMQAAHPVPAAMQEHNMRGLVLGIHVAPRPGYVEANPPNARALRLLVQRETGRLIGKSPATGFYLQKGDSVPPANTVQIPLVLELTRGEPVRITVVNTLDEPTGVHWHGLEIESFPDGVANWSGMGSHIFPPIAPHDSFIAAFTPPRSGTFPIHSHLNERNQILGGMYGTIIVSDKPRDLKHDHLVVVGGGGPDIFRELESPYAMVNGAYFPRPIELSVGETHRFRIVSIHPDWPVEFTLRNDSTTARWRAVAKDGHDMAPVQATMRLAHVVMGPGETADFELTPRTPGEWRLEVRSDGGGGFYISQPVKVLAAKKVVAGRGS